MHQAINDWLGGRRPPHLIAPVVAATPNGLPAARGRIQVVLRRVFGERSSIAGAEPDPGLCGPGSASWQVIAEPAAIAGGVRALVLQTLHPVAMAGVATHSRYRTEPLARLRSTSTWVTTSTFGTTRQVLTAARMVRRAHRSVQGQMPDGRDYRASDPTLLTWVSVALTSSFLAADRLWAPQPVTGVRADQFVAEQSRLAALLDERVDLDGISHQADALRAGQLDLPLLDELPQTVAQLVATLEGFAPELRGGEQAREMIRFLRWPPLPPTVRAAYLPLFAGAAASLAGWQRRMLGLSTSRAAAAVAIANTAIALGTLRTAAGRSPAYEAAMRRTQPAPVAAMGA
jgi:uncharacterized protein (DUF2236 family)